MYGCQLGRLFRISVAGGAYQDGYAASVEGVPPGLALTERDLYADLLLRKPGADELSSPRKEPDLPIILTGLNAAETVPGAANALVTNGTPVTILIPNLDRQPEHIRAYQETNRTPRPSHAGLVSFAKYGPDDDSIGAGLFSGRYTVAIVAAGSIAKKVLSHFGIEVFGYVKELAGVSCEVPHSEAAKYAANYRRMRRDLDPFYQQVYEAGLVRQEMRFLEKAAILAKIERELDAFRSRAPKMPAEKVREKYGVHEILNCPDIAAADKMVAACNKISKAGDSAGGIVEVVATGLPVGLGEPVFDKLDAELGRMLGIAAVKGVEIGSGFASAKMKGSEHNDQMRVQNGEAIYETNNAGGVCGGLSTGQPLVVRLAVKPTPTIALPQRTVDKYTMQNAELAAVTRRDPTIVARVWPVAEAYMACVLADHLMMNIGYQAMRDRLEAVGRRPETVRTKSKRKT